MRAPLGGARAGRSPGPERPLAGGLGEERSIFGEGGSGGAEQGRGRGWFRLGAGRSRGPERPLAKAGGGGARAEAPPRAGFPSGAAEGSAMEGPGSWASSGGAGRPLTEDEMAEVKKDVSGGRGRGLSARAGRGAESGARARAGERKRCGNGRGDAARGRVREGGGGFWARLCPPGSLRCEADHDSRTLIPGPGAGPGSRPCFALPSAARPAWAGVSGQSCEGSVRPVPVPRRRQRAGRVTWYLKLG